MKLETVGLSCFYCCCCFCGDGVDVGDCGGDCDGGGDGNGDGNGDGGGVVLVVVGSCL